MNKRREVEKKGEKNKRHEVQNKKEERIAPDYVKGMKPVDFQEELRNIIWEDASAIPHFKYARPPSVLDMRK